jgi:hypothetical protein
MEKHRRSSDASPLALAAWHILLLMQLAGCNGDWGERLQSGRVLAVAGLEGRWIGPVVPKESACGSATKGLMSIGEGGFGFDPFQSTTVIQGTVDKDRHLTGSLTRQGAEHQSMSVSFDGQAADDATIGGTVSSGRCHWTVTLHRG